MAAASVFSYAQAAKGQGTTTSNSDSPQTSSPAQGSLSTIPASATTSLDNASTAVDSHNQDTNSLSTDRHEAVSTIGSESDVRSESAVSRRTDGRKEDELNRLERPWRRADQDAQSTTRSDDADPKQRKNKKKNGEKTPVEEQPKVELSEAPIPSVNVWHQRKEAQAAAKMTKSDETTTPATTADTKSFAKAVDASSNSAHTNGPKTNRKADAPRPERPSRGARVTDKEAREAKDEPPPPVDDAVLWPTPETAVQEDKDSKKKPDAKSEDTAKPRSKEKWVTYDYVPTVNFETQLPQMRSSKPRGGARNATGGRTNASAHHSGGDKSATPASGPKHTDRRQSTNGISRTGSQPPGKRASVDVTAFREQRKASGSTMGDKSRETAAATATLTSRKYSPNATDSLHPDQTQQPRERVEGRPDRGRGGYRGRGGHHNGSHAQHQHVASFNGNGHGHHMGGRPQGPYSPPPRGGHGPMFMTPSQRGRGGRNNGANFHRLSLPNGRLPSLATHHGSFEYPMPPLSAMPFQPQPYWDNMMIPVLKNQIEYYFSIENLCKDMYLRARMDSQGFVPLHFIAAFKRVRELSADIGMLRAVCELSVDVDLVIGEDEMERVRRRDGWESFVLPWEDRDELARNHGPVQLTFKNRAPYSMLPQFNGMPIPYGITHPSNFVPQDQFPQYDYYAMNGVNGQNGHAHKGGSQLSAAVPDFAPSGTAHKMEAKVNGAVNGTHEKNSGVSG